jgi:hypothetical protein
VVGTNVSEEPAAAMFRLETAGSSEMLVPIRQHIAEDSDL